MPLTLKLSIGNTMSKHESVSNESAVYIVDGSRTPFLKMTAIPGAWSASDLAVAAAQPLILRNKLEAKAIGEVIAGCVMPATDEVNIARIIALRLGCGHAVPGWTVQRNCASGLQALDAGYNSIMRGTSDIVLAGGTEAMSRAAWLYPRTLATWMGTWRSQRTLKGRLRTLAHFRPSFVAPIFSLLEGLKDPMVNLSMGQTAENLGYHFDIQREAMDRYAVQSHQRAMEARKSGFFEEITPIFDHVGGLIDTDTGVRDHSSVEKLSSLSPVFDKPFGAVTAGNSSQISDGAAFLLLASSDAVKRYQLPVIGRIIDTAWAALDPAMMGLGPVHAIQSLLKRQHLKMQGIDYWEINEAFAVQVLACVKKLVDDLEAPQDFMQRLNVDGGAIALGHPVGASGARLVLHLLNVLKRNQAKRGIVSLCIGGGQGGAMLIENSSEV